MFCPKCGDEFRPGFAKCPDCEIALVDDPPAKSDAPDDEEMVTVATFENAFEASAARSALESRGIPAFAPADNIGSFSRLGPIGWAEVKVRRQDRHRAAKLLKSLGHI